MGSGPLVRVFDFSLADRTSSAFSDGLLPLTPPPMGKFDYKEGEVRESQGTTLNPLGVFTITQLTLVPEPSTAALLGVDLAGPAWRGRANSRSRRGGWGRHAGFLEVRSPAICKCWRADQREG